MWGQCASLSSESWGLGLGRLCFPLCCCFSVLSCSPTPTVPVIPSNGEALGRLLGSQSWLQKLRSLKEMESPPSLEPAVQAAESTKQWEKPWGLSDRPGKAKTCFVKLNSNQESR